MASIGNAIPVISGRNDDDPSEGEPRRPCGADPQSRHAVTRQLGAFRTSMLQDVEACKAAIVNGARASYSLDGKMPCTQMQ